MSEFKYKYRKLKALHSIYYNSSEYNNFLRLSLGVLEFKKQSSVPKMIILKKSNVR